MRQPSRLLTTNLGAARSTTTLAKALIALGLVGAGTAVGFGIKSVLAQGIPDVNPFYYSGTLTENGQLVTGTRAITVNLWQDGTTAVTPLCQTVASTALVQGGRFRVALAGTCKAALSANRNAWVEVVDGATSLGRAKIGAVPYALEADHASNATSAANATNFDVASNLSVAGAAAFDGGLTVSGRSVFANGTGLAVSVPIAMPAAAAGAGFPRTGTFSSSGGVLLVFVNASGFRNGGAIGNMQVDVSIDGTIVGSLVAYTNETASHKTFVGNPIVVPGLAAGTHTVRLAQSSGTADGNDYSNVTILELPL
jgi:hypothetical protein